MKYIILKNNIPIYLQLYDQIKDDILKEVYTYATKLPSKRLIAEEMGISVITVEHTYSLLLDEGFIESRERSGYFVCYNHDAAFSAPARNTKTQAPQSHNIELDDTFPFSVYAKNMRKVLSLYGDDIFTKCENSGSSELKGAIREYLSRSRGIEVAEKQIVIGAGAE